MQSRYQQVLAALDSCQAENADLLAKNTFLRAKVETLQRENAQLRRRLREKSREAQILSRALDGARFMVFCHIGGQSYSRQSCMDDGMSLRTWYWARALLRDARVHNGKTITTDDPEEISRAIERTVNRYEVQGFYSLRGRNPRIDWDREP